MRALSKNIKIDGTVPASVEEMKDGELRIGSSGIFSRVGNQILSIDMGFFLPQLTFDPSHTAEILILSNGNLTVELPESSGNVLSYVTKSKLSGKWYCELYTDVGGGNTLFGIVEPGHSIESSSWPGDTALSYGIYFTDGYIYNEGNDLAYGGEEITTDDIVMMALDMDNGKIYWGRDGSWYDSGDPAAGTNPAYSGLSGEKFIAVAHQTPSAKVTLNFGATDFAYTPPIGFKALQQ